MEEERNKALKYFGTTNIAECRGYKSNWIRKEIWNKLIDLHWNTPTWRLRSQKGKQNRNTEQEGGITKNTVGSIPFNVHAHRMVRLKYINDFG